MLHPRQVKQEKSDCFSCAALTSCFIIKIYISWKLRKMEVTEDGSYGRWKLRKMEVTEVRKTLNFEL